MTAVAEPETVDLRPGDRKLSTSELADLLEMTPGGLRNWRHLNKGPKSFKVGRNTWYWLSDVTAWLTEQERSTARGEAITEAVA